MKIEGIIVQGKQLGRTIGFPTANLRADRREGEGPNGVYAAWFYVDGHKLPCMVNIGHHPTLPGGGETVEAHIFDFSEDIYGKEVIDITKYGLAENKIILGEDEYFVMGDNRNHSSDSRDPSVGVLKRDRLIGRAWIRVYPLDNFEVF